MNRTPPSLPAASSILVEPLEPRIAPAGLLNESKFTAVTLGTPQLLDASGGPTDFQGLTTGSGGGSGSYLLYLTSGKALVYTTDLNGDGRFEPGEITGISLGVDSQGRAPNLILFSDVNGDIVTNLMAGHGVSALSDSDGNPNNGTDGRVLLPTDVGSITLRTVTASDLDSTIPGDTVANRIGLTSFSIHGNIYVGGSFGNVSDPTSGLIIDTSGAGDLAAKFNGGTGIQLFAGATPQVGSIITGSAVGGREFHFTDLASNNVEGQILAFTEPAGVNGGDISYVHAVNPATVFSVGEIITGTGGLGARGGNINDITLHGDTGSYELIAGDGGVGGVGGVGGSIVNFNDLGSITGQVILHTGAGGVGELGPGGAGGTATFTTTAIAASVEVFLGNGGDGFTGGGAGAGLSSVAIVSPDVTLPIGSKFAGTWHDIGDVGNTHPIFNADGTLSGYAAESINFNDPSFFSDPGLAATLGDHYGDAVFSTSTPGQVEVVFGDGQGGLNDNGGSFNLRGAETVYLRVPGVVNPVFTVGDFNGDGRPDIAVASGDPNNFGGVYIFLNQIGTGLDPINAHNFSDNPLGDHPFSDALQSPIPTLQAQVGVFIQSGAVLALTTGDYNGDGIADIALVETQHIINPPTNQIESLVGVLFGDPAHDINGNVATHSFVNTITGLAETRNAATGFFHANLAPIGAAPALQFFLLLDGGATPVLKSSALSAFDKVGDANGVPLTLDTGETFFYGVPGQKAFTSFTASDVDPVTHVPGFAFLTGISYGLGQVDTNRLLPQGMNMNISSVDATLQDFTIADFDNSGTADVAVLSKAPSQFLVTFAGDGAGGFLIRSNPSIADGQNSGVFLNASRDTPPPILSIVAVDISGYDAAGNLTSVPDGQFDEFAYLQIFSPPPEPGVTRIALGGPAGDPFYQGTVGGKPPVNTGSPAFLDSLFTPSIVADQTVNGLDAFYPVVPTPGNLLVATDYGVISPDTSDIRFSFLYILPDLYPTGGAPDSAGHSTDRFLTENGYFISAGNGGNATAGAGGAGGVIGTPALTAGTNGDVQGAIQITFPENRAFAGQAFLQGGNGGNGFGGGGDGGSVEGVTVRYAAGTTVLTSSALLVAGNGGSSIAGNGGAGGGINHVSVQTGAFFESGSGGSGVNGGAGGSIVGNATGTIFDTTDGTVNLTPAEALGAGYPASGGFSGVALAAGSGGQGSSVGGAGGGISGWSASFLPIIGGTGTSLYYATGAGGSAPAGLAGNGGAIVNSSPDPLQDNLGGDLHLQTGAGGAGLTGGDGGAITTFINQPTDPSAVPNLLSVTTGAGGAGITGNGGAGGTISGFQSSAVGLVTFAGEQLFGIGQIIAGDGGASFGAVGGNGGTVSNIVAQTTSAPIIVAAGAGGVGLTVGGNGGSVMGTPSNHAIINSAAQEFGKVLIVAGAGGDALSALPQEIALSGDPNTGDIAHAILAFGGVSAHAGDGGNITDVTQPISTQTAVDLVAGNGGSTPNAGTVNTASTGVGHGGSVVDVNLTGTVGAISRNSTLGVTANPPIQAYAYTDETGASQTLSITAIIDLITNPNTPVFSLTDNVPDATVQQFGTISGNEGIVAGAAGRVRGNQPASDGVNGTAQNISAESIMSIVAGSVSSVAPVSVLSGITVTDPTGVLGVDRSPTAPFGANGRLDYFNLAGVDVTNLQPGYSLVNGDGALYAISIQQTSGTILQGARVIPLSASGG